MKNIFLLLVIASSFMACKEDEAASIHSHEPSVSFISPQQGASYKESDTLWIKLKITSEDDLHEYLIQVRDIVENKMVYTYEGHSHGKSVDVNLFMIPNVNQNANMELIVTTLDHNSNKSVKRVSFKVLNDVVAEKPEIVLLSPNKSMFDVGDTVAINGYITHTSAIKTAQILVSKNGNNVFEFIPAITQLDSIWFDTFYVIEPTTHSSFDLTIVATDEFENTGVKTHAFHVHE
jgi:hypothetical protein